MHYENRTLFHDFVICSFKINNLNGANLKWSASRDLTLRVCLRQMLALPRWLAAFPSLSFMCASVPAYLNFEEAITGILVAPGGLWRRSWNVDRTDSSRQRDEWARVIAVDEASREVILPWKRWKWELRCRSPSWKSSYHCQHCGECCLTIACREWRDRVVSLISPN